MTADPYHYNQQYRSQIIKWSGMDHQKAFEQHVKDPTLRAQLEELGYLDPDCISYSFNSHGFRDDEFTNDLAVMALGCSFTEGVGVAQYATWPRQLSNMMGMRVWNLGVGGSSSDTAYRLAEYWLDHLNIKYVAMLVPNIDRFEVWHDGRPHVIMHSSYQNFDISEYNKIYWTNSENGQINQNKNLCAIKQLCNERQIPFRFQFKDKWNNVDFGRDLSHWGPESNQLVAEKMYNSLKAVTL